MKPRLLACALALVLSLPVRMFADASADLLRAAAEMERLANICHQNGVHYANSNDQRDADFQFAAEREYRFRAAQTRQRASQLRGSSGGGPGSYSPSPNADRLGQLQNLLGMGAQLAGMIEQRKAREQAAADQAQLEREVAEAERANAAAQKAMDDQIALNNNREKYREFFGLSEDNYKDLEKAADIAFGDSNAAHAKAARDVSDVLAMPTDQKTSDEITEIIATTGSEHVKRIYSPMGSMPVLPITTIMGAPASSHTPQNTNLFDDIIGNREPGTAEPGSTTTMGGPASSRSPQGSDQVDDILGYQQPATGSTATGIGDISTQPLDRNAADTDPTPFMTSTRAAWAAEKAALDEQEQEKEIVKPGEIIDFGKKWDEAEAAKLPQFGDGFDDPEPNPQTPPAIQDPSDTDPALAAALAKQGIHPATIHQPEEENIYGTPLFPDRSIDMGAAVDLRGPTIDVVQDAFDHPTPLPKDTPKPIQTTPAQSTPPISDEELAKQGIHPATIHLPKEENLYDAHGNFGTDLNKGPGAGLFLHGPNPDVVQDAFDHPTPLPKDTPKPAKTTPAQSIPPLSNEELAKQGIHPATIHLSKKDNGTGTPLLRGKDLNKGPDAGLNLHGPNPDIVKDAAAPKSLLNSKTKAGAGSVPAAPTDQTKPVTPDDPPKKS